MEIFGKRIGFRLTGGIATILLGALAAAQAQRGGIPEDAELADLNLPAMNAPRWQSEMPSPIAMPDTSPGNNRMAAFSAPINDDPNAGAIAQTAYSDEQFISQPVQPVGNDEPMSMGLPDDSMFGGPPSEAPASSMPEADLSMPSGLEMPDMSTMMMNAAPLDPPPAAEQTLAAPPQDAGPQDAPQPLMSMPEVAFNDVPMNDSPMNGGAVNNTPTQNDYPAEPASMGMPAPLGMPAPRATAGTLGMQPQGMQEPQYMAEEELPPLPQGSQQPQEFFQQPTAGYNDPYSNQDQFANQDPYANQDQFANQNQYANQDPYAGQDPYATQGPSAGQPQAYANDLRAEPPASAARNDTPSRFASQRELPRPGQSSLGGPPPGYGSPNQYETPNQYGVANNNFGGGQSIQAQPAAYAMPGERRLEGPQSPNVQIHKQAPSEVKVGQPATFQLNVQNIGTAEAMGVRVEDTIPAGMRFNDATPSPIVQGDLLIWEIGSLPVGEQRLITMNLTPIEEGELGSIARVTVEAAASVRTRSTRPELKITQFAPPKVLIGQQLEIELEVANVGTGAATNVVLREDVPEGMDHPGGRELDSFLNTLRPGEVRREVLRMRAVQPGMIRNVVQLVSDDAEPTSHSIDVEVIAPKVEVSLTGPGLRFLERQATYEVQLINRGTAPATNVDIIAQLDRGFTFVSTENDGYYDPNRHAVMWSVASLPPGKPAVVPLTLLPVEEGAQAINLEATADLNQRATSENTVNVQSQSELTFSIADLADPIELGAETTYEIRVKNSGSRNDSNVQVRLMVPRGLEVLGGDAEVRPDGQGGLMFAPQRELPAGSDVAYRIRVRGTAADTHVVQAIVTSDQSPKPVMKEESTMVYADR